MKKKIRNKNKQRKENYKFLNIYKINKYIFLHLKITVCKLRIKNDNDTSIQKYYIMYNRVGEIVVQGNIIFLSVHCSRTTFLLIV